jgi:hypothetical protein
MMRAQPTVKTAYDTFVSDVGHFLVRVR